MQDDGIGGQNGIQGTGGEDPEREDRERLFPALRWAAYLKDWNGPEAGERPAAYIVICAPEDERPFTGMDVGIAASYLVLAAAERGIGACMILSFDRGVVQGLFDSTDLTPHLVVALGYPGEKVVLERGREDVEYWRDHRGLHHVPKRPLNSIILDRRT